ncbi:hypothetical protein LG58_1267 [Kosakonia radicincitans YD4]|nr:hypothetical protein LG58_1267 [Kosakonia radicincitans YD4]
MMKSAALLFRNYHAKKSPFDINRSASRVHSCKAMINIVTLFNHKGSQCAFRTLKCALEEYARPFGLPPSCRSPTNTGKVKSLIICTGESVFISIDYVVNILFFPRCIIHSYLHFGF